MEGIELFSQFQFFQQVIFIPVTGQTGKHSAVAGQDENLQIVRTGAVARIDGIAVEGVYAGVAGIGLAGYVAVADHVATS